MKPPSLSDILQDLYNIGRHEEAGGVADRKVALEEAEAAINQYIREEVLKIVGEDEPSSHSGDIDQHMTAARNGLRTELRKAIEDKFGGQK